MDQRITELLDRNGLIACPAGGTRKGTIYHITTTHGQFSPQIRAEDDDTDIGFLRNAVCALREYNVYEYARRAVAGDEEWTRKPLNEVVDDMDELYAKLKVAAAGLESLLGVMMDEAGQRDIAYTIEVYISVNGRNASVSWLTRREQKALEADIIEKISTGGLTEDGRFSSSI